MGFSFAALFIVVGIFGTQFPLSAQELSDEMRPEPSLSTIDESTLMLGETAASPVPAGTSSIFVVLRMVLALALAALAIYGMVFFVKRLARPRERQDPYLKVLARVSLGNDSFAAVLSLGARAWLVGGGSGSINLISEIDDAESLETMLLGDSGKTAEGGALQSFLSLLRRLGVSHGEREAPPGISNVGAGSNAENLRKQRERLKRF